MFGIMGLVPSVAFMLLGCAMIANRDPWDTDVVMGFSAVWAMTSGIAGILWLVFFRVRPSEAAAGGFARAKAIVHALVFAGLVLLAFLPEALLLSVYNRRQAAFESYASVAPSRR